MSDRQDVIKVIGWVVTVVAFLAIAWLVARVGILAPDGPQPKPIPIDTTCASSWPAGDDTLAELFRSQMSDVLVGGAGTVSRLLTDDTDGSQHQRFILELASGQTLMMIHNIDLAPRLNGLKLGDDVAFCGEYLYSDLGGSIHWTHHDPAGKHPAGWLDWQSQRYQ